MIAFAEDAHELGGGVREACAAAAHKIDVAWNVQLLHFYFLHPAVFDFPLHAHARHDGHAHAHLYEALDAFDGGHLDGHVELSVIAREKFNDAAAEWRFDDVRDEHFAAQVGDVDFALASERMFRRNDEAELVLQDFCGWQWRVARNVRDGAKVQAIVEDFMRNIAGKHAVHPDLNSRMLFAKDGQGWQQGVDGAFVDA